MICNCCGGKFDKEENCPFCGVAIPTTSVKKQNDVHHVDLIKAPKPHAVHSNPNIDGPSGTVKVILKAGKSLFSPACESTYIMNIDGGKYQVRLELIESDTEGTVEVPYGTHTTELEYYSWDDKSLLDPRVEHKNDKTFTIDDKHKNVELSIDIGTLLKPQVVTLRYY